LFNRRTKQSFREYIHGLIYPRQGWRRTFGYFVHRLKRLPDSPHKIALGFACGIFVCFTPFFGLHVLLAALLALVIRGNVLAALIGTLFGNPFTFPVIGTICYRFGHFLLGLGREDPRTETLRSAFGRAATEFRQNIENMLESRPVSWDGVNDLIQLTLMPYFVGGAFIGVVFSALIYVVARSLVQAYQNRRKRLLAARRIRTADSAEGRSK